MAKRLSAAEIFDDLEVDLWGNLYRLRTITRSVAERLDEAKDAADKIPDDAASSEQMQALAGLIDALLEPLKDAEPAGKLLARMWDEDRLGLDWLMAFSQSLTEEAAARRRPTSAMKTGS